MTMRSRGLGRACCAALVALSVALLGACGDDDSSAADTTSAPTTSEPATTAPPPATTTPAAPTSTAALVPVPEGVDPAVVAELQGAIDAYDRAYALATAAPGDPTHVEFLAATTDGATRQGVQAAIADRRAAGHAVRPGPTGVVLAERIVRVDAVAVDQATVLACEFNGSEEYVVDTGEVLDDRQLTWENTVVLHRGDDGVWRVDSAARVGDYREVEANPCG